MTVLSVIIPTYNSEATIERCLASLVCQTYQDFEICIIDGLSTDTTITKIHHFRLQFSRIRILSEPDKGAYDAMNKGIDMAQSEWLYFLGSDDEVFDQDVFRDVFTPSLQRDCGMIYGDTHIRDETPWAKAGQIYDGIFDVEKLASQNICHQSIFYRKDLFNRFGKYNQEYPVCADWELNLRLFTKNTPIYLKRTIASFSGGGLSSKSLPDPMDKLARLRKRTLRHSRLQKIMPLLRF